MPQTPSSSFNAGSRCIIFWSANVFRFDQGRRRPHNPLAARAHICRAMDIKQDRRTACSDNSIVSESFVKPGFFRICPECGRWFALRMIRSIPDDKVGRVLIYRCSKCNAEIEYAERRPRDVL